MDFSEFSILLDFMRKIFPIIPKICIDKNIKALKIILSILASLRFTVSFSRSSHRKAGKPSIPQQGSNPKDGHKVRHKATR